MTLREYPMQISLNVLEHLGINLYSNVPSVLSEAVANAWDADAGNVVVRLANTGNDAVIVIQDDGIGMTYDEVKARFLTVGYRRRDEQPGLTKKDRFPMGRKGIGKLSLFSIANEIIVETAREHSQSAFHMKLEEIREAIRRGKENYEADSLSTDNIDFTHGTRITLKDIKKRQTVSTENALVTRLARRFSIIGSVYGFEVLVNDHPICPEDRGYYDKLQYVWTYGESSRIEELSTHRDAMEARPNQISDSTITVTGWLGTVRDSGQLKDDSGENLNRIAIFVRGKIAQEDILSDFSETSVYAKYLIGEIHVDGLDTYQGPGTELDDDAATSSRQRILEDDSRYVALKSFLNAELQYIRRRWRELRLEDGVKSAIQIPAVKKWLDGLPRDYAVKARQWVGKVHRISTDNPSERLHLVKHAILAFEFYRWKSNIDRLDQITDENLDAVISVFQDLDDLEASLYGQIVQQRIAVIRTLQDKVDENDKEKVIQSYIFDHLWLLDPSWERVEGSERMETSVGKLFDDVEAELSQAERDARIDIKYRKTVGKHVIIELKRPERSVSVHDLARQVGKYRSGMLRILSSIGTPHEPVEFVCLLGKPPLEESDEGGQQVVEGTLAAVNARYVNYDALLHNAFEAYRDYRSKRQQFDWLSEVIKEIDDYSDSPDDIT